MNKSVHRILLGILGATLGVSMMAAPLTVYANEQQAHGTLGTPSSTIDQTKPSTKIKNETQDPLQSVKASANKLGFDAKKDKFSLVSKTAPIAIVHVVHDGASYTVTLKHSRLNDDQWIISSVDKTSNIDTTSTSNTGTSSSNSSSTTTTTTASSATASDTTVIEQQAVDLLNADRVANGLPKLQTDARLTTIALNHAQDMIDNNYFSHTDLNGQSPFDRMKAAGISYSAAGENIATDTSIQAAEVAFMNSSGHRANILNSSYTNVGVGVAYDKNGNVYVVQDFIKP